MICAASLIPFPLIASAQEKAVDPVPVGVREPARFLDRLPGIRAAAAGIVNTFSLIPSFVAVDGASIYGSAFSWINKNKFVPLQLRVAAKVLDLDAETKNSASVDAKAQLYSVEKIATLSARAGFQRTFDVSSRQDYQLAGDHPFQFLKQAFSIGATGGYAIIDPDNGDQRKGATFASGLTWTISSVGELDADYQFRSDIEGEDDFSITAIQTLAYLPTQPTLIVVGGKHRFIAVNLVIPLFR